MFMAERNFVDPWFIDVAGKHRAVVCRPFFGVAAIGVGFSALENDCRNRAQRFHIVDDRGAAVEAHYSREGRLNARIPALAFERFHQRRFLAALVKRPRRYESAGQNQIQSQEYFSPGKPRS